MEEAGLWAPPNPFVLAADAVDPPPYEKEWYKPNPDDDIPGRARAKQRPPEGDDWWVWLLLMGRGYGKTRTGTEWLDEMARTRCRKGQQVLLAGRTPADVRTFALKGEGGLLTHHPDIKYAPSNRELTWPNGVVGIIRSGANPEEFRGFSGEYALLEELAAWDYPAEAWSNLEFGMRERDPHICIATTPRPINTLKEIKDAPNTVVVEGSSYENRANLSEAWVTNVLDKYKGTRLGEQEIYGKLLEHMEDALWRLYTDKETGLSGINDHRVQRAPDLYRVVVGVDPQGTHAEGHETGIVVVGLGADGHLYVLHDASMNGSPGQWGLRVVAMYDKYKADRVIGEVNYGGEMVEHTIRTVRADVSFKAVNATRGKRRRAEPIAALYEQGKVHHVDVHAALEDEMTTYVPDEKRTANNSPNRMDACLVGDTSIMTMRGELLMRDVCVGDQVWTRLGWRPVEAVRRLSESPTITVELSSGRVLRGTPEHLVWTENRSWLALDALVCGDILNGWLKFNTKASRSSETLMPSSAPTECISRRPAVLRCRAFIARFTKIITARFQKASSFIITTVIRSTMIPPIWSPCLAWNTLRLTPWKSPSRCANVLRKLARRLQSGTGHQKGWHGIESTAEKRGRTESRSGKSTAKSVESGRQFGLKGNVSVHASAVAAQQIESADTSLVSNAPSAPLGSGEVNTEPSLRPARASVVRSYASGAAVVYDIQIAEAREFLASGVIVHNCVWACTELTAGKRGGGTWGDRDRLRKGR